MRDDEKLLQEDVGREEQRAKLAYEQYLDEFRGRLHAGGVSAKRQLETSIATDQLRGREAQAARAAIREFDEDNVNNQLEWDGRRSWIAIWVSIAALMVASYAAIF